MECDKHLNMFVSYPGFINCPFCETEKKLKEAEAKIETMKKTMAKIISEGCAPDCYLVDEKDKRIAELEEENAECKDLLIFSTTPACHGCKFAQWDDEQQATGCSYDNDDIDFTICYTPKED